MKEESQGISFLLNGNQVHLRDVKPTDLLIDYLRSRAVNLTGTKLSCGEGGCGACTVVLSYFDQENKSFINCPINACLRPLCSLDGTSVTTIEGIKGSAQASLIEENMVSHCASQCGYCSPGFVMTMYGLMKKESCPSRQTVEDQFAGNICRCTGYISILNAMHQTGDQWSKQTHHPNGQDAADGNLAPFTSFSVSSGSYQYLRPTTIEETLGLLAKFQDRALDVKLVQGNTSIGIYKKEVEDPHILIDISKLTNFHRIDASAEGITLAGGVTMKELLDYLDHFLAVSEGDAGLTALRDHIRQIAGVQVRSVASVAGSLMLVKKHENSGTPFPGDLFTVLSLLNAEITFCTPDGEQQTYSLLKFPAVESLQCFLITSIFIPKTAAGSVVKTYRVARRTQNSHPIVNAAFSCILNENLNVVSIHLVYGGLGRIALAMPKTQAFITDTPDLVWDPMLLDRVLPVLDSEIDAAIIPALEPIFTKEFLKDLAINIFYKFYVWVCNQKGIDIDPAIRSAGQVHNRPLAEGNHHYLVAPYYDPATGALNKLVQLQEVGKDIDNPLSKPAPVPAVSKHLIEELSSGITLEQRAPQTARIALKETTQEVDKETTQKALSHVRQQSPIKIDAPVQVDGSARYTHDLPVSADTLEAFYVYSTHRHAQFSFAGTLPELCAELSERFSGAHFIHQAHIPAPTINDVYDPASPGNYDPVFAKDIVTCYGMPIGVVVAGNIEIAKAGAQFIQDRIVYHDMDPKETFCDLSQAIAAGSVLQINKINGRIPFIYRPVAGDDPAREQKMRWMDNPFQEEEKIFVSGSQSTTAQYHFYMEPQGALAIPKEDNQLEIYSSTQNQSSVHKKVAFLLGQPLHNVKAGTTRLGGGFGGKELRQVYVAGAAAVAAWTLQKPVRLLLNRTTDMRMTGTRHPFEGDYYLSATPEGIIDKMRIDYRSDAGISYDCSFPVMDLALLCAENAYYSATFKTTGEVYRTNIQSRTAFRSFGLVQAMLITETALEHLAFRLNMRPDKLRALNFYKDGQAVGDKPQYTPYGSPLPYCRINQVWHDFKEKIDFENRCTQVAEFNRQNRWRKRAISIIPLKYGISYTFRPMNQGSAYVFAYKDDGSVMLHHGGVEMGQGMHTKMVQIAAEELGITRDQIRIAGTNTSVIPNVSSTGASTGSDLNGYAVRRACGKLKAILGAFLNDLLLDEEHTTYPDTIVDPDTIKKYIQDIGGNWKAIIKVAAGARIPLSAQYSYSSPQLGAIPTTPPRENYQITPVDSQIFYYYTYCVAASEVEIDALTGQFEILRTDIVYDAGDSLNDNIDYGQIEGGFMQGVGCLTTEEMLYAKDGRVVSDGTWEYKPPCSKTIPQQFNVYLLKYESSGNKTDPPKDSYGIQSSKSTGEPPLVLANSVFFAIRQAVHEVRKEAGHNEWFEFTAPATVQKIQQACLTSLKTNNVSV